MDGQIPPVFYRTLSPPVPSRAAAQKRCAHHPQDSVTSIALCDSLLHKPLKLFSSDSEEYEIYSFELDGRLAPYFASYDRHHLYCPAALTDFDGTVCLFVWLFVC